MTISTPLLWIVLPLIIAGFTAIFYRQRILSVMLTSGTGLGLGLLAALFPEDLVITIGALSFTFTENLGFLGRQIDIPYQILPFIALVYFATGLWALASAQPSVPETFRPISLVITACLTAALGVRPFLYAALFIEAAILFSIPMLSPITSKINTGIIRYLSLQTLAMPFILLAGWMLSGVEALPPESPLIGQTMVILGLGIGLWLAVFPFHSWVPMVSEKAHPIPVSFILFIFPTAVLLFSLNFLDRYTFLRTSQGLFEALRIIGALMIVLGGLWITYQDNIKRALGFSILTETGYLILAIGLANQGGLQWLLMLYPVRAMGYWLWGYSLSAIETRVDSPSLKALQGFAHRYPFISAGLIFAQLSIAGLPFLASFPIKIALLSAGFTIGFGLGIWIFIGSLGLFIFTIRLLLTLVKINERKQVSNWIITEKRSIYIPVLLMILVIILTGLFPNLFLTNITNTLTAFSQLQ